MHITTAHLIGLQYNLFGSAKIVQLTVYQVVLELYVVCGLLEDTYFAFYTYIFVPVTKN